MERVTWMALFVVAPLVMAAPGNVRAADEWFVLGEKAIKSVDQGVEIKSEGRRWAKDVKQVKFGVEGADVEIKKIVLKWNNRRDEEITDIGVLKAGGQSTPHDAPGRKGQVTSVTVQYKIVGDAQMANFKIFGYD